MARSNGLGIKYLREGEQAGAEDYVHMVGDPSHQLRRQEVRNQTRGENVAELRVLLAESSHEQIGKETVRCWRLGEGFDSFRVGRT